MRLFIPLFVACAISSCARPDYAERWPASFRLSAGPQPGYAIKKVVDKQEPAQLIADDGSICRTSVERFTSTLTGKWIACDWALGSGSPLSWLHDASRAHRCSRLPSLIRTAQGHAPERLHL